MVENYNTLQAEEEDLLLRLGALQLESAQITDRLKELELIKRTRGSKAKARVTVNTDGESFGQGDRVKTTKVGKYPFVEGTITKVVKDSVGNVKVWFEGDCGTPTWRSPKYLILLHKAGSVKEEG